jgi:CrcB protein
LIRYLLVVIGGGTGALARYVAASAIMTRFGGKFPLGTLVINVTGSFLIGFLMRDGGLWTGMLNVVSSVMLGYVAVSLGSMLARR